MESTIDGEFPRRVLVYIRLLPSNILWLLILLSQQFGDLDVISASVETNPTNRPNQSQMNTHPPTQNYKQYQHYWQHTKNQQYQQQ